MLYILAALCIAAAAVFYIIYKISPRLFGAAVNISANAVISFAALTLYNIAAAHFGVYAGINIFSVALCAFGGIPAFIAFTALAAFLG